jgi:RHH-type transcriptional regulator, proline utilization regulon repressor / proline dehydrogenase / delta 1-pyrroline-5-carboxylate dehydrogenase
MDALEQRTQQIGRELFRRVRQAAEFGGPAAWVRDKVMSLVMGDEALKTSLFLLVDVLPAVRSPRQIHRHLTEYMSEAKEHLPPLATAILPRLPDGLIATIANFATTRLARAFIAADDPAELDIQTARPPYTIDLLGEAVVSEAEADEYGRRYHELISLPGAGINVSIKLSSLFSQFDAIDPAGSAAVVCGRLRPILRLARRRGAFVCFDMEQYAYKDLTLSIFKDILLEAEFRDWPDVGIAIQAYQPSSGDDLADLAAWAAHRGTGVWVRLVKGAYWDYESIISAQNSWPLPVYAEKSQTDANFEAMSAFLIERHDLLHPAIASHNVRQIAHALALAEKFRLAPDEIEFQLLHGMAQPIKTALVDLGRRVRVYAPVGKLLPGMAYLVRRLLENTSNQSFLRAALLEHVPEEELLMNPVLLAVKPKAPKANTFRNEPITDFSRAASRDGMTAALRALKPMQCPLVIGGQRIPASDWMESINPSHKGQIVGRCARATVEHARQAIAAAKTAFNTWRNQSADRRADLLDAVAERLRRRRFELAAMEVAECGKPWREADADVAEAIDFCIYYARQARRLGSAKHFDVPGETNQHFYEPRGVVAVIAPWNFPLAILCGMTAAAVATGNTAVIKAAEQSSIVGSLLMEAFEQAGAPAGVVNYLPGIGEEIGPELVGNPDVAMIAFTGSRQVGLGIYESAARTPAGQRHIKRVIAEMGGKNAIIVDADADADEAIRGVAASAFGYAGQKCSACSRLIVLEEIHDAFISRLIEAVKSLRVSPAEDPGCFVGPVIDAEAHTRILSVIEMAKSQAKLALGVDAGALAEEGFYIGPHVFTDVDPASSLAQEEIFGPVLACMKARDLDHALELANDVPYALTGGIYSRSPATIERARREFRVGDLYINRKITGALIGRQPFGGFKLSGVGSQAGGEDYLLQFLLPRVVTENTLRHGFAPGE